MCFSTTDFLKPTKKLGYTFKAAPDITINTKAYADDLTLTAKNATDNQYICDKTNAWLEWSVTMKAKPNKCVTLGFRKFHKNIKTEYFKPVADTIYSPFDPGLKISGQPMRFILNLNEPDPFKAEHFKFLGRWIHYCLSEHKIKLKIWDTIMGDFCTDDQSLVNGFMKLWIYQFYLLSHLSWPFLVYDFDHTFILDLQKQSNAFVFQEMGWNQQKR